MRLIGANCLESPTRTTRLLASKDKAAEVAREINPASSITTVVKGASRQKFFGSIFDLDQKFAFGTFQHGG